MAENKIHSKMAENKIHLQMSPPDLRHVHVYIVVTKSEEKVYVRLYVYPIGFHTYALYISSHYV